MSRLPAADYSGGSAEAGTPVEKLGISEQLIEQLPDAVFVVDSGGSILFVNAQGEALFGWTRAELVGRPIEILVPPNARGQPANGRA